MNKNNYKLLISGHKGYIGSYFCKYLQKAKINFSKFNFEKYPNNLNQYSHFFHFDFEIKIKKNSIERNLRRLVKILNLCEKNSIKLIFPSTVTFRYDANGKRLSRNIYPINEYSLSKIMCEKKILDYYKKKKINFFIFRIFNVYGGNIDNKWVVSSIIKKITNSDTLQLINNQNMRDFVHINDLCDLFKKSLKRKNCGIYEVGTGRSVSIKYLAVKIKNEIKKDINFILLKPFKSKKNFFSKANIFNTKKNFLWKPKISLETGLKKLIREHVK